MLRVITERQGDRYRLDLHGTLGGEWVAVLEQHWRSIMDDVPSAKLTLVLSNVDFIDPDGERLLHRMADDEVEFVVAGCMNRYVIDSLKPVCPPEGNDDEMSGEIHSRDRTRSGVHLSGPRGRPARSLVAVSARRS
jgi:hypothetical protein